MSLLQILRPTLPILIGASIMLTLSMGLRQSLGIFLQPLTQDIKISVSDFTLALAVQNLAWGFLQPLAGAMTVRYGFRPIMMVGSLFYIVGLALLASAQGMLSVMIGGGVLIGTSLACTAAAIAMSVAARSVPAAVRSTVMGMVSAAGSLGALAVGADRATPERGLWLAHRHDGFCDSVALHAAGGLVRGQGGQGAAAAEGRRRYRRHLGRRRGQGRVRQRLVRGDDAGLFRLRHAAGVSHHASAVLSGDLRHGPDASAQTLGMIGGFNVLGSLFFGWAGGRWNKLALLGGIYIARSLILAWYFMLPPSPASTLLFGALMGFLWMGVGPLVAGAVAEMFGLQWQAMIQGLAFMSHQLGSFLGAYGGGLIYDSLGSYTMAWRIGVALGLAGGIIQVAFALIRPSAPPMLKTA